MIDTAAVTQQALERILAAIEAAADELGRLDAVAGDGDHGLGMTRGFQAAVGAGGTGSAADVLEKAGFAFGDAAGGASGALVGTCLATIGARLKDGSGSAVELHAALQAGLDAMSRLGKSKVGDKTMIDAFDPFVRAFGAAAGEGASIRAAWSAALPAAEQGMQTTADMISRRGRSSRLGERSRGHLDPGAVSISIILRAVDDQLAESCPS